MTDHDSTHPDRGGIRLCDLSRATPVKAFAPDEVERVIDARHVVIGGQTIRVFPGTGRQVSLPELGEGIRWQGDSLGLGDSETITLADADGNWCEVSPGDLLGDSVWDSLTDYCRERIRGGLAVSKHRELIIGRAA